MKSSDVIKLENILENLKCETEREVNEIFENFDFAFTRKEKFLLTIPGLDILVIKKAAKRFYSNFKEEDKFFIKEKFSYIFGVEPNAVNTFIFVLLFLLLSTLYITNAKDMIPLITFCSILTACASFLSYFFASYVANKIMLKASEKNFLVKEIVKDKYIENLNKTINKEDFEEIKKYIDKESLKKLLVDNNFNISYKALEVFLQQTKQRIAKNDKYSKAEEILKCEDVVFQ